MSFFGSLFDGDKLSDRSQVHYDLAKIHFDKGQYLQALDALDQIESKEKEKVKVKELKAQIQNGLDESLDEEQEVSNEAIITASSEEWAILRMPGFDQERIQEYTDQGYFIESVCCGDEWVFVFRIAAQESTPQEYMLLETFEEDSFAEYLGESYYITQAASDGELWFFVMEQRTEWQDQFWIVSPNEVPREELKEWEGEGYFINILLEANNVFFSTAARLDESLSLDTMKSSEDPMEVMPRIWDEDKWLTRVFNLGDDLLYFYGSDSNISDQGFLINEALPAEELEQRLNDGHELVQLLFTNFGWLALTQKKKS